MHVGTDGCPLSQWDAYTHNEESMPFMDGETLTKFEVQWKILQMLCKIQNMGMTNQVVVNHAPTPRPKHDTNKKQVQ